MNPSTPPAPPVASHEPGSDELRSLLEIGSQLSNVAFNLAQRAGEHLSEQTAESLKQLQEEWDRTRRQYREAISAAAPVVAPAEPTPEMIDAGVRAVLSHEPGGPWEDAIRAGILAALLHAQRVAPISDERLREMWREAMGRAFEEEHGEAYEFFARALIAEALQPSPAPISDMDYGNNMDVYLQPSPVAPVKAEPYAWEWHTPNRNGTWQPHLGYQRPTSGAGYSHVRPLYLHPSPQVKAAVPVAIPEGWQLVPIEPTEEMWTAGRDPVMYRDLQFHVPKSMEAPPWRINPTTGNVELDQSKGTTAVHVYRAMLAAAPQQPAAPAPTMSKSMLKRMAHAPARTFSDFIRNATPEEREAVYEDVAGRAIARQLETMAPQELPAITVAFVDKDQPNSIAWCPGYPEGLPDITPLGAAPVAAPTDRSAKDYAIEHAEYMAVNAERLLSTIDALSAAELRREEHDDDDGTVADARDDVWSATRSLRSGIYEFRKRRERALSAVQPAGDVAAPPGVPGTYKNQQKDGNA